MTTLLDTLGGPPAVAAAVDEFMTRVLADPQLSPYFAGTDVRRLKGHQRRFLRAALSGSGGYTGRDLRTAHAGRGITEAAFDRVAGHLADTLEHLAVPAGVIAQVMALAGSLRADVTGAAPVAVA